LHLAVGAAALPAAVRGAWALDYPTRPVRLIVGFPAGTGPDVIARLIVRDIAAVGMICSAPFLLVANTDMPAKTLPEFIAYAKANPDRINMASPGIGTTPHLMYELLRMMTGIELVHVPYRGGYIPDLLSGQVQVAFSTITQSLQYVSDGRLRALAVSSAKRSDVLPDVPSIGESVPGYDASGWFGICAPKATPAAIIDKLNNAINATVAETDTRTRLIALGVPPLSMTSAEFGKLIDDDTEKWAKVIRAANIKVE